jgi:DNA-binding Lrp family transcriptional regulator
MRQAWIAKSHQRPCPFSSIPFVFTWKYDIGGGNDDTIFQNCFMRSVISDREKQIARHLQKDIFVVSRPFQDVALATGATEEEVLQVTRDLIYQRMIRKFSAIVRHQKIGFTKNAMVVWAVPEARIEEVGKAMASLREITHCYEREPLFLERYNLFCMVHLKDTDPEPFVQEIAARLDIPDYQILLSEEELKKSSMEYFI